MQWLVRKLITLLFNVRNSEPLAGVVAALGRPAGDFEKHIRKAVWSGGIER